MITWKYFYYLISGELKYTSVPDEYANFCQYRRKNGRTILGGDLAEYIQEMIDKKGNK